MGLDISRPVVEWDSENFADALEYLGGEFAQYADAVMDHDFDGSTLSTLLPWEIKESLKDMGVCNRIHRCFLLKHILLLLNGSEQADVDSTKDHRRWATQIPSSRLPPRSSLRQVSRSKSYTIASPDGNRCHIQRQYSVSSTRTSFTTTSLDEDDKALLRSLIVNACKQQQEEREALLARQRALQAQVAAMQIK